MVIIKKFLIALLVVLFSNNEVYSQSIDTSSLKLNWEQYALSNGLRVLLQQDISRSDVSIEFWLHSGTADEPPGQYGLAHFFEHATPYGLQDDDTLRKKLLDNMNFSNAQTRPDFTRYFMQVKQPVFELGLRYVSDRLKADTLAITDEWVELHRRNVLREFDRQTANPLWGGEQRELRLAGIFGDTHPYGHGGYGSRKNNEDFNAQAFRKWYEQHVFAENTTLFIIGGFEVKETKELIKKYFSNIHQKDKPVRTEQASPEPKVDKEVVRAPVEHHTLVMSWAVSEFGSEDDPALYLLANILNERLEKNESWPGSVSDVAARTYLFSMAGEFHTYAAFTALSDSSVVEQYIQQNFQDILSKGVTENEVKRAVKAEVESIRGAIENERMGMWSSRTALLGEGLLFSGDPDFYLTRLQKQSKLTSGQIQVVARKWLGKEPYQLLVISDSNEEDE